MFGYATGWLGYTPDVVLNSNISHLEMAVKAKFQFLRKTNPWRSQEDIDKEKLEESGNNPVAAANALAAWAQSMQGLKPRKTNG